MRVISNAPRETVVGLIAAILEIDAAGVRGTDRLREDLGMDSLGSLELLSSLGAELKLDLEIEDAMDISTVDDACAYIERKLSEQAEQGRAGAAAS
jgi:acyl carrier protein